MQDVLRVFLTSVMSFAVLFISAKIMGKKQIAQLEFVDYVIGISLGSIAAQMSVDGDIPFYHFLIAIAVYVLLDLLFSVISRKSMLLKKVIKGKPLMLIDDNKFIYSNLKKSKLDINEFLALCREKGYFNVQDIAYCVFETNGELSILPKGPLSPVTHAALKIKTQKAELSTEFIIDGQLITQALKDSKKTQKWLLQKLKISNKEKIKNIALATYDQKNDDVIAYYK